MLTDRRLVLTLVLLSAPAWGGQPDVESWGAYDVRHIPLSFVMGDLARLKGGTIAALAGGGVYFLKPDGTLAAQSSMSGGMLQGDPVALKDGDVAVVSPGRRSAPSGGGVFPFLKLLTSLMPTSRKNGRLDFANPDLDRLSAKIFILGPDGRERGELEVQGKVWALTALREGGAAAGLQPPGVVFLDAAGKVRDRIGAEAFLRFPGETRGGSAIHRILELPDGRLLVSSFLRTYVLGRDRKTLAPWSMGSMLALKSGAIAATTSSASPGGMALVLASADGAVRAKLIEDAKGFIIVKMAELDGGDVAVGLYTGDLFVFGPDGRRKWRFKLSGAPTSSPIRLRNGGILVGSKDRRLYFLSPEGALLGRYKMEGPLAGRPVEMPDGTILAATTELGSSHNLYLFTPTGRAFVDMPIASGGKCRVAGSMDYPYGYDDACPKMNEKINERAFQAGVEDMCISQYADSRPTNFRWTSCRATPQGIKQVLLSYDCEVCSDDAGSKEPARR
ncbi:MAG: PQQ-binding-like beta-propeller repeat protein [Elusimicrobiota bacterium]